MVIAFLERCEIGEVKKNIKIFKNGEIVGNYPEQRVRIIREATREEYIESSLNDFGIIVRNILPGVFFYECLTD